MDNLIVDEMVAQLLVSEGFSTLEEVVDHYDSGGVYSNTIDPLMKKLGVGLQLTHQEKEELVAFLKTLSDTDFNNNIE